MFFTGDGLAHHLNGLVVCHSTMQARHILESESVAGAAAQKKQHENKTLFHGVTLSHAARWRFYESPHNTQVTDNETRLLEHIRAFEGYAYLPHGKLLDTTDISWQRLMEVVSSPDFERCGDSWCFYVPYSLRPMWDTLSNESKLIAFCMGNWAVALFR